MSQYPHGDTLEVLERELSPDAILEVLEPHINQARREKMAQVVSGRTYSIVTVCDNLYDTGNMAAVMRSAEAMGIQEFHSIQRNTELKRSQRITAGADKWLDIHLWEEAAPCVQQLKERGYRIVSTQLSEDAVPIESIDFTEHPTAIVFGNERSGVSPEVLEASDICCILPMLGFAESYNISVAAALSYYHVRADRLARQGHHGDLSEEEQRHLLANFYMRAISRSDLLVTGLLARRDKTQA